MSSLRESINGEYIANQVRHEKHYEPDKTHLLVEGDDDEYVFSRLISEVDCKIRNCQGKCNLIRAIEILNQSKHDGYLGIKDSDFDVLDGHSSPLNVMLTDGHDLEIMILNTRALDNFIDAHLIGKDRGLASKFKSSIKERLSKLAAVIGYLRFVSHRCSWGVNIHTLKLLNHLNSDCELSLGDAASKLKTACPEIDETQINETEFKKLSACHLHYLCRGKDMIEILSKIFSIMAQKHFCKKVNPGSHLAKQILMVFNQSFFKETQLYQQIKEWEANNKPYLVLKE